MKSRDLDVSPGKPSEELESTYEDVGMPSLAISVSPSFLPYILIDRQNCIYL
jgi:hypothetical protein